MSEIENAIDVLENNISSINTVSEWSNHVGFNSERYFSRQFRNHFGSRPKEVITQIKLDKIRECMARFPDQILYCTAKDLGFADDQALYKFIKRHTGKSPTEFKREGEKGG